MGIDIKTIFDLIFENDETNKYTLNDLIKKRVELISFRDRVRKQCLGIEEGEFLSMLSSEDYQYFIHILDREIDVFEHMKWKSAE